MITSFMLFIIMSVGFNQVDQLFVSLTESKGYTVKDSQFIEMDSLIKLEDLPYRFNYFSWFRDYYTTQYNNNKNIALNHDDCKEFLSDTERFYSCELILNDPCFKNDNGCYYINDTIITYPVNYTILRGKYCNLTHDYRGTVYGVFPEITVVTNTTKKLADDCIWQELFLSGDTLVNYETKNIYPHISDKMEIVYEIDPQKYGNFNFEFFMAVCAICSWGTVSFCCGGCRAPCMCNEYTLNIDAGEKLGTIMGRDANFFKGFFVLVLFPIMLIVFTIIFFPGVSILSSQDIITGFRSFSYMGEYILGKDTIVNSFKVEYKNFPDNLKDIVFPQCVNKQMIITNTRLSNCFSYYGNNICCVDYPVHTEEAISMITYSSHYINRVFKENNYDYEELQYIATTIEVITYLSILELILWVFYCQCNWCYNNKKSVITVADMRI